MSVLVDTNVIIESHRTSAWRALVGGHRVETVEDCVAETQTGFQLRRQEQANAVRELRASVAAVHAVDNRDRAELAVRTQGNGPSRSETAASAGWHSSRAGAWNIADDLRSRSRLGENEGLRTLGFILLDQMDFMGHVKEGDPPRESRRRFLLYINSAGGCLHRRIKA